MALRAAMATFNTPAPRALATWWAEQTGGRLLADHDGGFVVVGGGGAPITLGFQYCELPAQPGRLHLDFTAADPEAEVERLLDAGASFVERHDVTDACWVVLADPEGNQFCVQS